MDADQPTLLFTTGDERIDEILRGVVTIFTSAFPERIQSCYLFGSHADGSAVPSSDIDLFVVFAGDVAGDEKSRARMIARGCGLISPVQLDILVVSEADLLRDGHFRIEHGSTLIWGDDLRDRLPKQSIAAYLSKYTHGPYAYMAQVHRHTDQITVPLDYPDPAGEFFGYDKDFLPPSSNRLAPAHNIEALVATACWIASILIGLETGRMVHTKAESARLYRECVGDEWADFVEEVYEQGKRRWGYLVPTDEAERQALRDLCRRMLAFENHYLSRYRDYLLRQIREGSHDERLEAVQRLGSWVRYPDDEVKAALEQLAADQDEPIRSAARQALGTPDET